MKQYDFSHLDQEWQECISMFLDHVQSYSGSISSRVLYACTLERLFRDVSSPADINRTDVLRFLREPSTSQRNNGKPVTEGTANNRLMVCNSWWKWASQYLVNGEPIFQKISPSFGMRYGKPSQPYRNLSEDEVNRLFGVIPDSVKGARDRAILLCAFFTTRRRSELCRLRWKDIAKARIVDADGSARDGYVFFHVDKGKSREVHSSELLKICYDAIITMLERQNRLETIQPDDPLFTSTRTDQVDQPLCPDTLNKTFHLYAQAAGLDDKRMSFHSLRHAGATARARAGESLPSLMRITGHSNLASLDRYLRTQMPVSDSFGAKLAEQFSNLAIAAK